jgi:tryptophan synthase alpha chain
VTRIGQCLDKLKVENRKALVAFITAGDPDIESTKNIFNVIDDSGADIIELGVPFSDPLADGPVIQASALRALKSGTTLKKIIALIKTIRKNRNLPIILMTSFNPVFVYGENQFIEDVVSAGVDGVIIPDLPPEEAIEFSVKAEKQELDMIHLLAPTSTDERVQIVAKCARGFIYYISLTGTTGARTELSADLFDKVSSIKQAANIPVLVGFGISTPETARDAARVSDGVIVGSAIVNLIEKNSDPSQRSKSLSEFVGSIKQAINEIN